MSDDTEALDEFERLLNTTAETGSDGRDVAVLYLKHAKAADVEVRLE